MKFLIELFSDENDEVWPMSMLHILIQLSAVESWKMESDACGHQMRLEF